MTAAITSDRPCGTRSKGRSTTRIMSSFLLYDSARQINLCEVDQLRRPTVENSLHHEHPKMIGLIDSCRRRHGELLASADHVDQYGSLVRKCRLDRSLQLLRLLDTDATDTHRVGHSCEVGIR